MVEQIEEPVKEELLVVDNNDESNDTEDEPRKTSQVSTTAYTHVYVYHGKTFEHVPKTTTHVCLHPNIREVPKLFFVHYRQLTVVQLNVGLLQIGDMAFWSCPNLREIFIPSTVISIGRKAFADCVHLQFVDLPNGLLTLGDSALCNCTSLQTISLPSSLVEIRKRAFENCTKLRLVELRQGLEVIGEMAFQGCSSVQHVNLPTTVKFIGKFAFAKCSQLLSVELPKKIESIGYSSFAHCDMLRNIIIPKTSNSYGNHMFGSHFMLEKQFPHRYNALKCRFDGLPLHQICYFHSYHPTLHTLRKLSKVLNKGADPSEMDSFGLNSFHLLALSTKLDLHVWMTLMPTCDVQMVHVKDCWGCSPLYYLCVNRMINSTEVLRYVVRSSIEHQLGSVLEQWKLELVRMVHDLHDNMPAKEKMQRMNDIYSQLTVFVWRENFSLLELALWKKTMQNATAVKKSPSTKEQQRNDSRIICGIEVVSSNVLPFLGEMELKKVRW